MQKIRIGLSEPAGPRAPTPEDVGTILRHHWTEEDAALLGTVTDVEVAARVGVSVGTVLKERKRRRIPPFTAQAPIRALHLLPGGGMKSKTVHDVSGAGGKTTLPLVKGAAGTGSAITKIVDWVKSNPALALGGAAAVWYFFLRQPRGSGMGDFGDLGDTRRTLDALKRKGRR